MQDIDNSQLDYPLEDPEDDNLGSLTQSYFEVKVLIGGLYDQIAIGLTNNPAYPLQEFAGYKPHSLAYHADDGKCYING